MARKTELTTTPLDALQAELAALPALIVAARAKRNLRAVRKMRARQEALTAAIEAAQLTNQVSEINTWPDAQS